MNINYNYFGGVGTVLYVLIVWSQPLPCILRGAYYILSLYICTHLIYKGAAVTIIHRYILLLGKIMIHSVSHAFHEILA